MNTTKGVAEKLAKDPLGKNGKDHQPQTNGNPPFELPAIIPLKKENEKNSIEDRFYKMDVLFSHREKWEKIKESLDKVSKFKLTTDGRSDNITLKDGANNSFSTYNPEVLAKVIDWLKEDLSKKLQEVESQIVF